MTNPSVLVKDGFVFSGNWQQAVSKALFLDQRLTPLERNAWQVLRMLLEPDGITALPTYEKLRPYLTSMPYAQKASFETVARALTILRLTRWLSLSKRRRAKAGFKLSNLYILHDEPLTPFEAIRLDDEYFILVCQSISHASIAIQKVAAGVLDDINQDPFLSGKRLPTRLEILLGRMSVQTQYPTTTEELSTVQKSEVSENDLLRNQKILSSESEASLKPSKNNTLRNPNKAVSSSNINKILLQIGQNLAIPQRFYSLSAAQQKGILKTIQKLAPMVQQQIFNEWEERCQTQTIRKPAAYLFGIAQKAFRGELNDLIDMSLQADLITSPAASSLITPNREADQEEYAPPSEQEKTQIRQNLQRLKDLFTKK